MNSSPTSTRSPQARYASLHRTIEQGMATDATWLELGQVCLELELHNELLASYHNVNGRSERVYLRNLMDRHGLPVEPEDETIEPAPEDASHGLVDDLFDALHFLREEHMPGVLAVSTATFPLALVAGRLAGMALPFSGPLALIPILLAVLVLGTLVRRVLLFAAMGIQDAPALPSPAKWPSEALRFLRDAFAVGASLLVPAALLLLLGLQVRNFLIGLLLLAGALLPMACLLRVLRQDWRAVAPHVLVSAIVRRPYRYFERLVVMTCLFVPSAIAWTLIDGSVNHAKSAIVGPLVVVPLFLSASLLGRFLHANHHAFAKLVEVPGLSRGEHLMQQQGPLPRRRMRRMARRNRVAC